MYIILKRLFDIVISSIAIIVLAPIFLVIIIILRFSSDGEVFYLQERIGTSSKTFRIWKFATMVKNSLNIGAGSITLRNDPRVTKIGRFLRKTKINELPQIFNILIGDISIVGPRPLVFKTFNAYSDDIQKKIYKIKPGLTGIGSIVFRDEESIISDIVDEDQDPHEFYRTNIAPYKGKLEIWYFENRSFILDLQLIFLTAWVIFFPNSKLYYKWYKDLPKKTF